MKASNNAKKKTPEKSLFIGLSGIELPVPKYQFPPEYEKASRLTYYATFFNTIEVNSSFYKIPMKSTPPRWSDSVPSRFKFTFKLFRELTHIKDLFFDAAYLPKFMETISGAGDKKGCLLIQFPPSLESSKLPQLDRLLARIRSADAEHAWNLAVEFRHKGWYNDSVFETLKVHGASLVIHDMPKSATPLTHSLSDVLYVRFHGPTGNYRGSYTEAFLAEYAGYIKDWMAESKTVYAYFNNTAGDAFNNARTLRDLLREL